MFVSTERAANPVRAFWASFPLAFALIFAIGSLADLHSTNWAVFDEREFHLPLANHFIDHPIRPDFPTIGAMTPGTHILVALTARLFGVGEVFSGSPLVRLLFCGMAAATLSLTFAYCLSLSRDLGAALCLALPLLSTTYFLLPATFLVTEGPAYLGYVVALGAMLFLPLGVAGGLIFALGASVMALSRQIFLPVAAAYALHALPLKPWKGGTAYLLIGLVVVTPLAILSPVFLTWGGLVPESYRFHETSALNFPVLVQAVGLAGILGVPFLAATRLPDAAPAVLAWAAGALAAALALWLSIPTVPGPPLSRSFSVIWRLADASPLALGRPVLLLGPLLAGCLVVACHMETARRLGRIPVEWAMFGLYVAALMNQSYAWQRYVEVPLLITLAISTACSWSGRRWGMAVLVAAYALYLALSIVTISGIPIFQQITY